MQTKDKNLKYDRKAVYTGRRLFRSGSVVYRFELLPEKTEMFFSGIRGLIIGYTYACSASQMPTRPVRLEDEAIENPEWEVADALVDAEKRMKREEAKLRAKASPSVKKACEALRPLMIGKDYFSRKLLIEYLADKARAK